jgi:hypothetical protein
VWPESLSCCLLEDRRDDVFEGGPTLQQPAGQDPLHDPANHFAFVTGTRDWARHEVTAQIPLDATNIIFGVFLAGRGQIELRNPELEH